MGLNDRGTIGQAPPDVAAEYTVSDYRALILGVDWLPGYDRGTSVILTYSFSENPTGWLPAEVGSGYEHSFQAFSAQERTNARAALTQWAEASGVIFLEDTSGAGDIQFGKYDFSLMPALGEGTYGFAFYPDLSYPYGGDILIDRNHEAGDVDASLATLLHEIGHALGLKHPFEGYARLEPALDTTANTVMSYTGTPADALRQLDIDAITHLYGPNSRDASHLTAWNWDAATNTLTQQGTADHDNIRGVSGRNILYGGNGRDTLTGGAQADYMHAGADNDWLVGNGGADTLRGGLGNDRYQLGEGQALIIEYAGEGYDTLSVSAATFVLSPGASIEEIFSHANALAPAFVTGNEFGQKIYGSGSGVHNTLYGMGGNDELFAEWGPAALHGGEGSDTLNGGRENDLLEGGNGSDHMRGGAGIDTLVGGAGDDFYYFDLYSTDQDIIVEDASGGNDRVRIDLAAFVLTEGAVVERLEVVEWRDAPTHVTGNAISQTIVASDAAAVLLGMSGNDTLIGGAGDDFLDGANQNDALRGGGGHDTLLGGRDNDLLEGGAGNDRLSGDHGIDTLVGGAGDDVYVNIAGDTIVELAGEGRDTIESDVSFALDGYAHVENVTLVGTGAIDATGDGFDNLLTGGGGANVLTGGGGNDTLAGGDGVDRLIGGVGNDTYINPAYGEIVEIAGQGFDRIVSDVSFSLLTLPGIERLELMGAIPGFLRGNGNANSLIGNSGSNAMHGYDGNDTILGLGGRDTITGGMGRDQIAPGLERDTIVWNSVAESTGAGRDSVSEFVFSQGGSAYETLDFHVVPTAVRASITAGVLREAAFDDDMQAVMNASNLGAGEAVLFDPSGGDLNVAGHVYLIVDANGVAGYQAGQDYVVQFTSTYGTLTLANFI